MSKQKGRPKGAKNVSENQTVVLPQCGSCGSSERTPYQKVNEVEHGGKTAEGEEYTHIVFKRTKCKNCGQQRVDRIRENRKTAK